MDKDIRNHKHTELFFDAVLSLRNREECAKFFEDVCTIQELGALSQRMTIALELRNKLTYQEIAEKTGASTATISRINRCLLYGADGYNTVLDRIIDKDGK